MPLIVERFLGKLEDAQRKRVFAICNCGGHEIVNAVPSMRNFRRVARSLGIRLAAEYTVRLPMNNLDYEHTPVPIETDSAKIRGACSTAWASAESIPVWRFYNVKNGSHFYTISSEEKQTVIDNLSDTYTLEGIAWWINQ